MATSAIARVLFLVLLIFPISAWSFERSGWPGEGIPRIKFTKPSYAFCPAPKHTKLCSNKSVSTGATYSLSSSEVTETKQITISPAVLVAKEDFILDGMKVVKGQKLLNYQYAAEGYFEVGVGNEVYQVYLSNYEKYFENPKLQPVVEWWVKFAKFGWLELTSSNVEYLDRSF